MQGTPAEAACVEGGQMRGDQLRRSIVDALRTARTACTPARFRMRSAQPAAGSGSGSDTPLFAATPPPLPPRGALSVRLSRLRHRLTVRGAVIALVLGMVPPVLMLGTVPAAQTSPCPVDGCTVTVDARDFTSQAALPHFNYVINV